MAEVCLVRVHVPEAVGGGFITLKTEGTTQVRVIKQMALQKMRAKRLPTTQMSPRALQAIEAGNFALARLVPKGSKKKSSKSSLSTAEYMQNFFATQTDGEDGGMSRKTRTLSTPNALSYGQIAPSSASFSTRKNLEEKKKLKGVFEPLEDREYVTAKRGGVELYLVPLHILEHVPTYVPPAQPPVQTQGPGVDVTLAARPGLSTSTSPNTPSHPSQSLQQPPQERREHRDPSPDLRVKGDVDEDLDDDAFLRTLTTRTSMRAKAKTLGSMSDTEGGDRLRSPLHRRKKRGPGGGGHRTEVDSDGDEEDYEDRSKPIANNTNSNHNNINNDLISPAHSTINNLSSSSSSASAAHSHRRGSLEFPVMHLKKPSSSSITGTAAGNLAGTGSLSGSLAFPGLSRKASGLEDEESVAGGVDPFLSTAEDGDVREMKARYKAAFRSLAAHHSREMDAMRAENDGIISRLATLLQKRTNECWDLRKEKDALSLEAKTMFREMQTRWQQKLAAEQSKNDKITALLASGASAEASGDTHCTSCIKLTKELARAKAINMQCECDSLRKEVEKLRSERDLADIETKGLDDITEKLKTEVMNYQHAVQTLKLKEKEVDKQKRDTKKAAKEFQSLREKMVKAREELQSQSASRTVDTQSNAPAQSSIPTTNQRFPVGPIVQPEDDVLAMTNPGGLSESSGVGTLSRVEQEKAARRKTRRLRKQQQLGQSGNPRSGSQVPRYHDSDTSEDGVPDEAPVGANVESALQSRLAELRAEKEEAEQALLSLQLNLAETQRNLAASANVANNEVEAVKTTSILTSTNELSDTSAKGELAELKSSYAQLIAAKAKDVDAWEQEIAKVKEEKQAVTTRLEAVSVRKQELEAALRDIKKELDLLQKEIVRDKRQADALRKENAALKSRLKQAGLPTTVTITAPSTPVVVPNTTNTNTTSTLAAPVPVRSSISSSQPQSGKLARTVSPAPPRLHTGPSGENKKQ